MDQAFVKMENVLATAILTSLYILFRNLRKEPSFAFFSVNVSYLSGYVDVCTYLWPEPHFDSHQLLMLNIQELGIS